MNNERHLMSQLQLNLSCDNRNKRTAVSTLTAYKLALFYDACMYVSPILFTYSIPLPCPPSDCHSN